MSHIARETTEKVAPIVAGAAIAKTGAELAVNTLPQLAVTNTTRAALGALSATIFPAAALMTGIAGISLMTKPLFAPWTSPDGGQRGA